VSDPFAESHSLKLSASKHDARTAALRRRRVASRRRAHLGAPIEWLIVLLALVTLAIAVAMLALVVGERNYANRIYPNVSIRGVAVGDQSIAAARDLLQRRYADFLHNPLELTYGDQTWRPSAAELGVRLDFDQALQSAAAIGRTDTRLGNARTVATTWDQGIELSLHVAIDQLTMQRYLLGVASAVETLPHNAGLWIEGAQVVVIPEQDGLQVLVDETLRDLTAALQALEPQSVSLRTRTLPPQLRDVDVAPVIEDAQTMLAGPIMLTSGAQRWEWSPAEIARWMQVRQISDIDDRPAITLSLDQAAMRSALVPIATVLRVEGTLPRVDWNNGNLQIRQPGNPGRGLDAPQALAQITTALRGGSRSIELPMITLPPPVTETNLASLGITEQIGVGVSSFRASQQYRITNIRAGSRRMDGLLIPPGATFSFNANLGPVDARNGFVEGLAIVNNRTQKEWGGGLCQVSTTVFRAAFWSGLAITERHEHAFRISWYEELGEPPGLDATIYTGVTDMRFINDTGGWILMQTYVDLQRQRLTVALYGAPSARQVSMDYRILERTPAPTRPVYVDDPSLPSGSFRQTDVAQGGMTVEVYRVVRENGRVLYRDTFPTKFQPWPNIYVRGAG
jgi:vancomycin resistance protein YoaR